MDNEKKIPVVNGDGKLDISPVSDNLEVEKPTEKKRRRNNNTYKQKIRFTF